MTASAETISPEKREQRRAIGQRLREWRLKRDLSQAQLARAAGITQASLSNYETGKRDLPLSTFLGVASGLDVSLGDLLDIPAIVVVRDSRVGRAVETLVKNPELADRIVNNTSENGAAS